MPNIKPISDLRNYANVLREVSLGDPVYLTKNGRGAFAILDINELEDLLELKAHVALMTELGKGIDSISKKGGLTGDDIKKYFEEKHRND